MWWKPRLNDRGKQAEEYAYRYLKTQGLDLIERNYRCNSGEIDLIMEHDGVIVFVEVRFRRSERFGSPAETVDYRKRRKLIKTALHYLQAHPKLAQRPSRLDVMAVSLHDGAFHCHWIPDAFQVT